MAYITVYYIDFDTKEVISTYDYSLEVGQTQSINVQDHIPAGYLDLFTYNNGNFVYDNSIQVVADKPLYVNGQTGDRFTNNVICFVSATWDGTSNLPIDDLSDGIEGMSVVPVHTSEIAPIDIVDSISITENAMSGQFLTIGDICYPTCSVSLFKGEYTTATVFLKGSEFYVVAQMFGIYQILGKFTITNEPVVGTDTVSFEASGVLSSEGINSVVDLTEVLTEQRKAEILEVQPSLESIVSPTYNNMSYYWYFIVEDIFNLFGIPLIIDRWDYCREDFIASNNIMELLIPTKTITTSDTDEDGVIETTIENEKEVTWKDIICNIALLLNCNIVEHGGVIHLKRLPTMGSKAKKFYVGADIYDDNSRFSNNNYWLKSATIKYREYAIRNSFPQPTIIGGPEDAVFWGNNTRSHTAFEGIPTTWNAGAIEYETIVNCAYFRPYFWRSTQTNNQLITLLWNKRAAKALYRSFDIDEDITWEGLNVFNGVPDVVYTPADVNFLGWNPLMSIGNCFICTDYEGDNRIIYVGNQTISYSGGVTVSVSSACNLEDGTSSEYTTSEISSTASGGVANIQSIVNQMLEGVLIRDNVLNGSKITDATITGGKIADATITNTKIADSTITGSKIADSTITNTQIANSTITGSKIVDGTLDGSTKIADATISFAKIDNSFVGSLFADSAFVQEFKAEVATFGYITSAEADLAYADIDFANIGQSAITNLTSNTAFINALDAEIATFGYITAQQADLDYAQIDFANVANGAIGTALIQDGAISDAKIGGMSANKLTAGTIDASNITVTNLNATNITTGRITVDGITIDVTNNEASIDGGYIENGTITMNGFSSDVVARIDGAIETFTCTDIPTLQNYPASTWTASDYDKHVGDVAYVVNPSSSADGYTYRFTKSSDNQFSWVLIKDTDITKALQDILDLQGDIDAIERFDSEVSSFMINTDDEIASIKRRTSSLETTMGTKVDTSTFNELSQTVNENHSSITSLSQTVSGKADSSTVSSLSNTVNTISQKTDTNTSNISSLTTTVSSKADASNVYTKTETDSKIAVVQQDLTGFKITVSDTYTTKTEFNNLNIGGRNLLRYTSVPADLAKINASLPYWSNVTEDGIACVKGTGSTYLQLFSYINDGATTFQSELLKANTTYTYSAWIKVNKAGSFNFASYGHFTVNNSASTASDKTHEDVASARIYEPSAIAANTWTKIRLTFTTNDLEGSTFGIYPVFNNGDDVVIYMYGWKLEKGNHATDWTPAPEDFEDYTDTAVSEAKEETDDKISALTQRVTSAESSIIQNAEAITSKVSKTDFTGQNMMSLINQDASSVTISASKVNLDGAVTFSSFSSALQDQVTGISTTANNASSAAATAQSTANKAYDHTSMEDTRYDNQAPSWYMAKGKGLYNEFKECYYLGLSVSFMYCYLTTFVPWPDSAGGYPVQEAKFSESDAVYRRYGTSDSEWSAWKSTSKILAGWQYSDTTYIDGGNIYTGTITAGKITVGELSDLADDIGTITAGVLKSHNYVADTSGMKLTLSDGVWDSKDFKISSTGAITSTAGTIGGWTIGSNTLSSSKQVGNKTFEIVLDSDTPRFLLGNEDGNEEIYSSISSDKLTQSYFNSNNQIDISTDYTYNGISIVDDSASTKATVTLDENGLDFSTLPVSVGSSFNASYHDMYIRLTDNVNNKEFEYTQANGLRIKNGNNYVFTADTSGNLSVGGTITAPTLSLTNGGSITSSQSVVSISASYMTINNKKAVVDDYSSGFMAFTNDSASATTVYSSTSTRYNLASVTLTPGVYIIECVAEWRSNSSSGYRDICLSTSSQGGKIDKYCESTVAPSSAYDRQIFTYTTHITSNTTFYLTAQQNSGGDISTLGGIRALRIGNN